MLSETVAVTADRLIQMSARDRDRRASETAAETADRQAQDSTLHQQRRARAAVIRKPFVIGIREFRDHMAKLQFPILTCTRCNESFPDMKVNAQTSICERCNRDKDPNSKLFSKENSIDPGDIPPELSDLTQIEQMVIAQGCTMIQLRPFEGHPNNCTL
jgi:hypothetical protein